MYRTIARREVHDLWAGQDGTVLSLSGGVVLHVAAEHVEFGQSAAVAAAAPSASVTCFKNIEMEPCGVDLVKSIAAGKLITSAGDFGTYVEVGLDQRFNLGLHPSAFHIISTENPVEDHRL